MRRICEGSEGVLRGVLQKSRKGSDKVLRSFGDGLFCEGSDRVTRRFCEGPDDDDDDDDGERYHAAHIAEGRRDEGRRLGRRFVLKIWVKMWVFFLARD